MAVKTQGTQLFAIDPDTGDVITVGCPTSIDGIDTAIEQIETTCLDSLAREYVAGMPTPGTATFAINTDPQDPSHVRLHELKIEGALMQWAVGWSDGTSLPTSNLGSDAEYAWATPPTSRSWILFEGFMNSFPFTFALNSVVQSTVGIQVSGEPQFVPKVS